MYVLLSAPALGNCYGSYRLPTFSPSSVRGSERVFNFHRLSSQDGVSQSEDTDPLSIPHLNRLVESSIVWDEIPTSNTVVTVIPLLLTLLVMDTYSTSDPTLHGHLHYPNDLETDKIRKYRTDCNKKKKGCLL
jgi:hypothetical protein